MKFKESSIFVISVLVGVMGCGNSHNIKTEQKPKNNPVDVYNFCRESALDGDVEDFKEYMAEYRIRRIENELSSVPDHFAQSLTGKALKRVAKRLMPDIRKTQFSHVVSNGKTAKLIILKIIDKQKEKEIFYGLTWQILAGDTKKKFKTMVGSNKVTYGFYVAEFFNQKEQWKLNYIRSIYPEEVDDSSRFIEKLDFNLIKNNEVFIPREEIPELPPEIRNVEHKAMYSVTSDKYRTTVYINGIKQNEFENITLGTYVIGGLKKGQNTFTLIVEKLSENQRLVNHNLDDFSFAVRPFVDGKIENVKNIMVYQPEEIVEKHEGSFNYMP